MDFFTNESLTSRTLFSQFGLPYSKEGLLTKSIFYEQLCFFQNHGMYLLPHYYY